MSVETYDFILCKISHRIKKKITNFKKPISPAESLQLISGSLKSIGQSGGWLKN